MATITSNGTGGGLWSAGATWVGGVAPVDADTVVIAAGDTVTFNVDTSGFANGIAGITITGTLKLTRTTGTYYLKLKTGTTISGAGTFDCGTSGDQIPFTAKHTVDLNNGNIGGSLIFTVYSQSPTIPYVSLSNAESAGATRLEIDRDVTGDLWEIGNTISICNINAGKQVESRTITDIQPTYIDVSAGLTNTKLQGAYVVLETRHINFVGTSVLLKQLASIANITGGRFYNNDNSRPIQTLCIADKVLFHTGNMALAYSGCKVSNSIFLNCSTGSREMAACYFDSCAFIGCTAGIQDRSYIFVDNCLFAGCLYAINASYGAFNDCHFIGNGTGIVDSYISLFNNCVFENNTVNTLRSLIVANNCLFNGSTEFTMPTVGIKAGMISISYNHNQTDGAIKALTDGGSVATQTSVKPTGYQSSQLHALSSGEYETFYYVSFTVRSGESVNVEVQLRKSASMTYLPRAYLTKRYSSMILPSSLPLLDSFTMTDSTDTWESDTFSIDNSAGTTDKDYTLWFVAKNASGNVYSAYDITTQGGGTSSVKILPFTGKVGL